MIFRNRSGPSARDSRASRLLANVQDVSQDPPGLARTRNRRVKHSSISPPAKVDYPMTSLMLSVTLLSFVSMIMPTAAAPVSRPTWQRPRRGTEHH